MSDTTDCVEWQGSRTKGGYGQLTVDQRPWLAHRLVWEVANGSPGDLWVLHSCDNPPCINVDHLFLGTRRDNEDDKVAKGRQARPAGELNGQATLCAADVHGIRAALATGETQRSVAHRYGISQQHVSDLKRGKRWGHLLGGADITALPFWGFACSGSTGVTVSAVVGQTEYMRTWRKANHERENTVARRRRANDPDYWRKQTMRRHGLTLEQYDSLLVAQDGKCATCGSTPHTKPLEVDHDHKCCSSKTRTSCGQCVRGLLCSACNRALGCVRDDPEILLNLVAHLHRSAVDDSLVQRRLKERNGTDT